MIDFFVFLIDLGLPFPFYCLWFKSVGLRLWWIFFCFFIWSFFFHFIGFGLSPSGLGYFFLFLFFDLELLLPFYCLWIKSGGFRLWRILSVSWFGISFFRLWWIFFCFLIWGFFFRFIAFSLSPSGLGNDGFFFFLI